MVKIIVFDVDGTLLHRSTHKVPNKNHHETSNGRYIYYRPQLNRLRQFLEQNHGKMIPVLWSSMRSINLQPISVLLEQRFGLKFKKVFHQEYCEPNLSKNLKIIAKEYQTDVCDVFLVDDSVKKRIENQNFIEIRKYDTSEEEDDEIVRIVGILQNIISSDIHEPIFIRAPSLKPTQQNKPTQEIKIQPVINPELKVIVFDLNKTLMKKIKQKNGQEQFHFKINGTQMRVRPYIQVLRLFHETHNTENEEVKMVIWTSMSGRKQARKILQHFQAIGVPVENVLESSIMKQEIKDLETIAQMYQCSVKNTILVDDSAYKRMPGQNFIQALQYCGQKQDRQLIRIVDELDKFIGCKEDCNIKKLLDERIKVEADVQFIQKKAPKQSKPHNHPKKQKKKKEYIEVKKEQQTKEIPSQQPKQKKTKKKSEIKQIPEYMVKFYPCQNSLPIKCLVFDLNETLMNREKSSVKGVQHDKRHNNFYNYLRPHLQVLQQFLSDFSHLKKIIWTTIKLQNSQHMRQMLEKKGLHFDSMLTQENLIENRKDLNLISTQFHLKVQQILLIDDSLMKRVNNQNFMHVRSFEPQNREDEVLVHLVEQLRKIINKE